MIASMIVMTGGIVERRIRAQASAYLEQNPDVAGIIIERAIAARQTRLNLGPA